MAISRSVLAEALRSFCVKRAPLSTDDFERQVDNECIAMWEAEQNAKLKKNPSLLVIPRIFAKKDETPNSIAEQVRREARIRMLKKQELLLLEQEDLELCHELLALHATPTPESPGTPATTVSNEGESDRINYDGFCQVRAQLPEKFDYYFSPSTFLRMSRDEYGRIGILPFYQFVVGRDALLRKRITLGWYDYTGSGYLREVDLNNFVQDEISNSPILSQLGKSFQAFYICTAVRNFLFFLDAARRGKVRIRDMIRGTLLDDLLALRQPLPEEALRGNWFAPAVAERVYRQYTQLDTDGNGMLAPAELLLFPGAYLTEAFVERVFEECQTYRVEGHPELQMDFKSFLDLVIALENRNSRPAIQYLWRIVDFRKRGRIGAFEIHYFFRQVQAALVWNGHAAVDVDDVTDEIMDMVRAPGGGEFGLEELVASGVGGTVLSILFDMHAFYQYDNRESLLASPAAGSAEEHA